MCDLGIKKPTPTDGVISIHGSEGRLMVTIRRNGDVEFGGSFDLDETARLFWEAVAARIPNHLATGKD